MEHEGKKCNNQHVICCLDINFPYPNLHYINGTLVCHRFNLPKQTKKQTNSAGITTLALEICILTIYSLIFRNHLE